MNIEKKYFGTTKDGTDVDSYKLISSDGSYVTIITYGLIVQELVVPNKHNELVNVVLGYNTIREYEDYSPYYGCIVGRYAGRIESGEFIIDDKKYELDKQDGLITLHGGTNGFDKKVFDAQAKIEEDKAVVEFKAISKHLDQGFPGELALKVVYKFDEKKNLSIEYAADTTVDTVVSLTNHSYFNLTGSYGKIYDEILFINANRRMTLSEDMCPNGLVDVDEVLDFRKPKRIGDYIKDDKLLLTKGYDHPYELNKTDDIEIVLIDEYSGIKLEIETTEKCVVFYSQNYLCEKPFVYDEISIDIHSAVCLETQYYPNSINIDGLKKVLKKGDEYNSKTVYRFGLIDE